MRAERRIHFAWVVLSAGFVLLMFDYGMRYAFGVFLKPVAQDLGWTRSVTSLGFSIYMLVYGVSSLFAGILVDRIGPRYTTFVGGLLISAGFASWAFARSVSHFYISYGIIIGVGAGFLGLVPVLGTIQKWFVQKRGLATGIADAGVSMGTLVFASAAAALIEYLGWRMSCLVLMAFPILAVLPLSLLLVRSPEDKGMSAYGSNLASKACQQRSPTSTNNDKERIWSLKEILTGSGFCRLTISYFCIVASFFSIDIHLVAYASDLGVPTLAAAGALGMIGIFSIPGRIVGGLLSDFLGRRQTLIAALALSAAVPFLLIFVVRGIAALYVFASVFGIAYGLWAPIFPPTLADLFGSSCVGKAYGAATLFGAGLGGAVGPLASGFLYDSYGSYLPAFYASSVLALLSLLSVAVFGEFRTKPSRTTQGESFG
jgi:OFA family oxalate/formate antiporter-like MFS transporter